MKRFITVNKDGGATVINTRAIITISVEDKVDLESAELTLCSEMDILPAIIHLDGGGKVFGSVRRGELWELSKEGGR